MYKLPTDPIMLLSYVNLKLRDEFPNLEDFCALHDITKDELIAKLASIDYHYAEINNQFK